jgi:hypothetical protein
MTATRHGQGARWRTAGLLLLALALVSGGCDSNPARARAVKQLATADLPRLRFDAAVTYKNAFAGRGPQLVSVQENAWPPSFRVFSPLRVTAYPDGIALGLDRLADRESGLWIVPQGMTHDPAATPRATFQELREGVYWYEFGRTE